MDPSILNGIASADPQLAIDVAVKRLPKEPGLLFELTERFPDQFSSETFDALSQENIPAFYHILVDFTSPSPVSEVQSHEEKVRALLAERTGSMEFDARGDLAPLLESARNIPNSEIRKGYLAGAFARAARQDVILASLYLTDIVAPEEKAAAIEAILPFMEEPEDAAAWRAELRALQAE